MLLLQYPRDLGKPEVAESRKLILGIANELSLKVIDTYDVLRNGKENELWYNYPSFHHTPLGNELVARICLSRDFQSRRAHLDQTRHRTGEGICAGPCTPLARNGDRGSTPLIHVGLAKETAAESGGRAGRHCFG
jgi:hypothetical protein